MPNWCDNTIRVSGEAAEIAKFNEWLGDGKAFLSKINPTPQPLVETVSGFYGDLEEQKKLEEKSAANVKEFGHANWYDWNIANWSTKWDVDAEIADFDTTDTEVIVSFQSAWSPPQRAIATLAEKFPSLNIRHSYFEEGMCFVGIDEYEKGEIVNEIYNEDSQTEEWKQLARDEFGWEPWENDEDELEENEEGKVTEVPKSIEKPAKKKVKKTAVKKTTKKTTKKVSKKKTKKKK